MLSGIVRVKRFQQVVFIVSLVALSWFAFMAVHELGHVVGAVLTGGTVERVVLHPLTISRTDVAPNPCPLIVVWLGPILGCALPVIFWFLVPRQLEAARNMALFFVGFCLVANGAYIACGTIDKVGDCGVMLKHGSPAWTLFLFGALVISLGVLAWHRLGSMKAFWADPDLVKSHHTWFTCTSLVIVLIIEFAFSPM